MSGEFVKFIRTGEINFKYAKGMRDIYGKEIHTYNEIFFYMGGDAKFISEAGTKKLLPRTTVFIPKETFHCFTVMGPEEDYCRCVLNFEYVSELDEIISKKMKRIFLTQNAQVADLFLKMRDLSVSQMDTDEKNILLKSLMAQVLVYVKEPEDDTLEALINPITERTIDYIEKNMEKPISVELIANELYVSPSHLAHIFKKDLHIPIYKYILEKRLVLANKKIKNFENPTQVAIECGFRDYSGFYRQYKKMFGVSPAEYKRKNYLKTKIMQKTPEG